jgi:hypothetical protein
VSLSLDYLYLPLPVVQDGDTHRVYGPEPNSGVSGRASVHAPLPTLPCPIDAVRHHHATVRPWVHLRERGFVDATSVPVAGVRSLLLVEKSVMNPETLRGRRYHGSIWIPAGAGGFIVELQAEETGMTGLREALVFDRMLASGEVERGPDGPIGWLDEADAAPTHLRRNRSEHPSWDGEFPDHPLTRLRQALRQVAIGAELSPHLRPQ